MTAGTLTLVSGQSGGGHLQFGAAGSWTAENAALLEPLVDTVTRSNTAIRSVAIDTANIDRLDSFGAWLLRARLAHMERPRLRSQTDWPQGGLSGAVR